MSAVRNRLYGVSVAGFVAAAALIAPAANASGMPAVTISLTNNNGTTLFDPAALGHSWSNPNKTYGFNGQTGSSGQWGLGWSLLVNPDPFIIANFVVTNNSLVDQEFSLTVTMPIDPPGLTDVSIGGSVTGTLTDLNGNGATLSSASGGSIYSALVDNAVVATLLDDPFSVSTGAFESAVVGPASFGEPIPSQPSGDALNTMAITLNFVLSAGDAASFTSIFVLVGTDIPAPGALALLGVAGLFGRRRRRDA